MPGRQTVSGTVYKAAELKTLQEVITLVNIAGFSVVHPGEALTRHHAAGFALIAAGAGLVFSGRG